MSSEREHIHKYFMDIAYKVASRSTCIKRKVGAIIVKDKRIVSTGYNNPSCGLPNCTKETCILDTNGKCRMALHAECSAIIQAHPIDRQNAIMYITCQPCANCQLAILNSGVKAVIYDEEHTPKFDFLKQANIPYMQIDEAIKTNFMV